MKKNAAIAFAFLLVVVVGLLVERAAGQIRAGTTGQVAMLPAEAARFPIHSSLFTAPNNPFHLTYDYLKSLKNQAAQPPTAVEMSRNFWAQGLGYQTVQALPLYVGTSKDPAYVVSCTFFNPRGCDAQGLRVHLPIGWKTQPGTDKHVASIDLAEGHEIDLWGGGDNGSYTGPKQCNVIEKNTLNCSWGGTFPFRGKGITMGGAAVAGGFAEGLFEITAGDLLSGRIHHALGVQGVCLDDDPSQGTAGAVYPSGRQTKTDGACVQAGLPSGAPPYGAMWHVKDSVDVTALGYSKYCEEIVEAMQTYGAYLMDSGNNHIQIEIENPIVYDLSPYKSNPFYTTIFPSMVAGGDGRGEGYEGFSFKSCLQRLNADDFEVFYVPNLGF